MSDHGKGHGGGHEKHDDHPKPHKAEKAHGGGGDFSKLVIQEGLAIPTALATSPLTGPLLKVPWTLMKTPFVIGKGILHGLRALLKIVTFGLV